MNESIVRSSQQDRARYRAMVVTDLDGTLLDSNASLSEGNRDTLHRLGEQGVLRVVATGRNLYSARLAIAPDMPIDYLVFASGAGTVAWPDGELLDAQHLDDGPAYDAAAHLLALGLDFMLHGAVPNNHWFWYCRTGGGANGSADFERRLKRYEAFCEPLPTSWNSGAQDARPRGPFSQLLAVQPLDSPQDPDTLHAKLRAALAPLNVIRATSPLDHQSAWFEVFANNVSKATGAQGLRCRYGLNESAVLAVGNDYNDEEMLSWATHSAVVANAPDKLRARYRTYSSNDADGFSDAVSAWLQGLDGLNT